MATSLADTMFQHNYIDWWWTHFQIFTSLYLTSFNHLYLLRSPGEDLKEVVQDEKNMAVFFQFLSMGCILAPLK